MFRVIIAGSRTFNDYDLLKSKVDFYLKNYRKVQIISGTAEGADKLGERYARERGCSLKQFPAKWEILGKSAGPMRNREMARNADALIAFWDGKSAGTRDMIQVSKTMGLKVRVVIVKNL